MDKDDDKEEYLPPAYGGCTCSCHVFAGTKHMVACCGPGMHPDPFKEGIRIN